MVEIRRFTKLDWNAWSGAESFSKTSEPLIYERSLNDGLVDLIIIADKNGIEINVIGHDDEENCVYTKELHQNSIRAMGELKHLAEYLEKYTYAPDLVYELDHPCEPIVEGYDGQWY